MQEITTYNAEQTKEYAKNLSANLKGGEVILLYGDLGSGKTTFVQGLAEGLGIKSPVLSPTFVLRRQHLGKRGLIHYDFYRLESPKDLQVLDLEADINPENVVIIEWADKIGYDKDQSIKMYFRSLSENERVIKSEDLP
jgi:tRNA threonylcarbamoyladenosine biosynthesis protein TsaE